VIAAQQQEPFHEQVADRDVKIDAEVRDAVVQIATDNRADVT
jgi:frataxin-like iron-binding protein CyaY